MLQSRLPVVTMCAASVCLAFAMAGCASQKAAHQPQAGSPDPSIVAKVDTEADGQPAQPPPPISIRATPDEPREPWSRNYGSVPPARGAEAPVTSPEGVPVAPPRPTLSSAALVVPAASPPGRIRTASSSLSALPPDLPPDFRRRLADAGYR
jgi:hypothetical protein